MELSVNLLGGFVWSVVMVGSLEISHIEPIWNPISGGFEGTTPLFHANTISHPGCVLQLDVPYNDSFIPSHVNVSCLRSLTDFDIWLAAKRDQINL